METLSRRLTPDTYEELREMIGLFERGEMPDYPAGMERHFAVAKKKPEDFKNHAAVLGISIGGSSTKVMLGAMKDGFLEVKHLRAMENPTEATAFDDFLDKLIANDPAVDQYLRAEEPACIGVSLPMAIIDGCPYHPTKIPTLSGMIARTPEERTPEMRFDRNFKRYLRLRRYPEPGALFYQADGIVAQHGAVSLLDMGEQDRTVLCICGTGMANGDERSYLPIALIRSLPEDNSLFPPEETENRQLNYAVAGKGIYALMRRAIAEKIREGGSAMEGKGLDRFFRQVRDTRNVFEIWQTAQDKGFSSRFTDEIRTAAGDAGFQELQQIAGILARRVAQILGNTIVSTFASMDPLAPGGQYILFFEGSIATNRWLNPLIQADVREKAANREFFASMGRQPLAPILMNPSLKPLLPGEGIRHEDLARADITLMGAVTMIMAQTCQNFDR